MRVLLLFHLSLQGRQYSLQDLPLFRVAHVAGFRRTVRIAAKVSCKVRTAAWTARQASFVRPSPVSTWLDSTFNPAFSVF